MEFWGQEVNPGEAVSCGVSDGFVVHLSQVALGETKKESENIVVFVTIGGNKFVIGTLSAGKHPQISCDLIFDEDFELSHNSKTAKVFLCGYKTPMPDMFESDYGEDEDEEMEADENPVKNNETEIPAAKIPAKDVKKDKQDETSSGEDDLSGSDSEDDIMSEDDSSEEDGLSSGSDEDDSSESEDEETPVPQVGKKRASTSALKTPASDKKAKISTPEKGTGKKKGVHIATPHPAKQASKTPADGKLKEKAPKTPADSKAKEKSPSSGSHSCKSCSKAFGSAGALESHQKAKKH